MGRNLFPVASSVCLIIVLHVEFSCAFLYRDLLSSDPSYKLEIKLNLDGHLQVSGLTSVRVDSVACVNEIGPKRWLGTA